MREILSLNNRLIKDIKSLYRKKNRYDAGLFIIEGIKILEEALEMDMEVEYIFYTDDLLDNQRGYKLFERLKDFKKLYKVSDEVFTYISDTETPQGILGIIKFRQRKIDEILESNQTLVFLDSLQDPGNLGTIIRSADAFNIQGIIIGEGTVDPYNPKVVRATMGSIFRVPIYFIDNLASDIFYLKSLNYKFLATSLDDSEDIRNMDFQNSVIIIGNESKGVSQELFDHADRHVKIKMLGKSESLNAGVAASIIMYEASKDKLNC